MFKQWKGFRLFCPEDRVDDPMYLKNRQGSLKNTNIVFSVSRCVNSTKIGEKKECESPEKINNFIKDVTIDFWSESFKMDIRNHKSGKKPTYFDHEILGQHVLSQEIAPRITISLERVEYKTIDDMVNFGKPTYSDKYWHVRNQVNRPLPRSQNSSILFQTQLYLMPYKQEFFREIYNLSHLASDLGGLFNSISLIALIFIYPISRFLFYIGLMQ